MLVLIFCLAASLVTSTSKSEIKFQKTLNQVIEQTAEKLELSFYESESLVTSFIESKNCLNFSNELLPPFANCWNKDYKEVCPMQQVVPAGIAGYADEGLVLTGLPKSLRDKCYGFVVNCYDIPVKCNTCAQYRTIDGTCNNLDMNSNWGSINRAFRRSVPNNYDNNVDVPTGGNPPTGSLPTPRAISNAIHQHFNPPQDRHHTLMVMQLGQFLDHDITFTPEVEIEDCCSVSSSECFPINITQPDPHFRHTDCLPFARSAPKCSASEVRNQFNAITAYLDGSHIYGSTEEVHLNLRTMVDGKLKTSYGNNLPRTKGGGCLSGVQLEAGDRRATENPGLQSLHTIFMREHNRIAKIISALTAWDDEKIYQQARRIVVAEWQNIVYGEFLPEVLGPDGVPHSVNSVYNSSVDASINNVFATAAFRFGHSLITGSVQIFNRGSYLLNDNFADTSEVLNKRNLDGILKGATQQKIDGSDRFIHNSVRNHLFENLPCHKEGGDLSARNIQRGRDHGLGTYSQYWNHCGFQDEPTVRKELLDLYKGDVGKVEIFPGALLEDSVTGGLVGKTFHCLIKEQFQRLKDGDRFFFTHKKGSTCDANLQRFTETQQTLIMRRKLRDVICDNSGVDSLQTDVLKPRRCPTNRFKDCSDVNRLDGAEIKSLLNM